MTPSRGHRKGETKCKTGHHHRVECAQHMSRKDPKTNEQYPSPSEGLKGGLKGGLQGASSPSQGASRGLEGGFTFVKPSRA